MSQRICVRAVPALVSAVFCLFGPSVSHADLTPGIMQNYQRPHERSARTVETAQHLILIRTIEDLVNSSLNRKNDCTVTGTIKGDLTGVKAIGVLSGDFRIVYRVETPDVDGKFSFSGIEPGSYVIAPLPNGEGPLVYTPPHGYPLYCRAGRTFTTEFSIQGVRSLPKQMHLENDPRNLHSQEHPIKKRQSENQSQQRWSDYKRRELVIRILRDEKSYEEVAQEHDLSVEQLKEWRDQFLLNAEKALQPKE